MEHSILASLTPWGFGPELSQAFSSLVSSLGSSPSSALDAGRDLVPARVISHYGAYLEVVDAACPARRVQPSGRLRHTLHFEELPTVGDWVAITAPAGDEPALIHGILPRTTQLIRRAAGKRHDGQVIAANVDTFFVVTSANRDANPRRLERYLTAVRDSGAAMVIVVNKTDLADPAELAATLAALTDAAPDVAVVAVSAHRGDGLAALEPHLRPGHTVALIGSSGVGKSSLVNHWFGFAHQLVHVIDDSDRGRHTTSRRELFALPGGALVIDTPGMRELALLGTDDGLDETFADVTALAAACRFRDCRHQGEPGCAVDAAIDAGELDPGRLAGMHKLERELAAAELRRDRAERRAERARMKVVNRSQRARGKLDPKFRR
ncbi:MAG TPA: ribosome small subunit-dependent GTPase A [Kofleriaceae bacterium]|nr:ribosome small subunit-dependent GTPase A [Kofleriaceae bacterium]